jgi:hypothetical protein
MSCHDQLLVQSNQRFNTFYFRRGNVYPLRAELLIAENLATSFRASAAHLIFGCGMRPPLDNLEKSLQFGRGYEGPMAPSSRPKVPEGNGQGGKVSARPSGIRRLECGRRVLPTGRRGAIALAQLPFPDAYGR